MTFPSKVKEYHDEDKCKKCGDYKNIGETFNGSTYEICYQCGKEGKCRDIEKGGFAFEYKEYEEDKLSHELVEFKEGRKKDSSLLNLIKSVAQKHYPDFKSVQSIIPIPPRKNSSRQFNSPNKIAKSLEQVYEGEFKDVLRFNKETKPQKELSFDEKFKNVDGAISLKTPLSSDEVLVVDDVFTSGATVMEAAKVLKRNGVESIYVFCIGRSEPPERQRAPEDGWPGHQPLEDFKS